MHKKYHIRMYKKYWVVIRRKCGIRMYKKYYMRMYRFAWAITGKT